MDFSVIIPTIPKDFIRVKRDIGLMLKYLGAKKIIFIGPESLRELVISEAESCSLGDKVSFLEENTVLSFDSVKTAIQKRIAEDGYVLAENSRPGWYYQQFLKMAYSVICEDEYYMSWDADTLPLRDISMFDENGKPYFDVKSEYIPGYFNTIKRLFGFNKLYEKSFISEHMIFKTEYMRQMISEMEMLPFKGERFFEKIFYAQPSENMYRGFSEFETYGTWCLVRHPEHYSFRDWKSLRGGGFMMDPLQIREDDLRWLGESYDAVTFESYNQVIPELQTLFCEQEYRSTVTAEEFYNIILNSGLLGDAGAGGVVSGDSILPV